MSHSRVTLCEEDIDAIWRVAHARAGRADWVDRPALCGVSLRDGLAVCTDSYRLAACPTEYDGEPVGLSREAMEALPATGPARVKPADYPPFPALNSIHVAPAVHTITVDRADVLYQLRSAKQNERVEIGAKAERWSMFNMYLRQPGKEWVFDTAIGYLPPVIVETRYLIDALHALGCHKVLLSTWSPRHPLWIGDADEEGDEMIQCIMPGIGWRA
jgi:hypothetical protein